MIDTRPLAHLAFRRLWISTVVTAVGSQLTAVAVPKQLYDITGSSAYVGLAGAVALIPLMVFGLWGGVVADVVDRRRLMLITNTGIAMTSFLFFLQAATGSRSIVIIYALLAVQQACFGINQAARGATIPRLVPREVLPAANALGSTVGQGGQIFGPLLAGALIPVLGISRLYLIDSIGLTVMIWAVWRLPALPPLEGAPSRAGLGHLIEGFRYMASRDVLLVSLLADLVAMIFGMPRALFPQLAQQTFSAALGAGPALGLLYAALPAGALAVGLLSGLYSRTQHPGRGVVVAVCTWGLAIVGFGLARSLWMGMFFLAVAGGADMVSMVLRSTILQAAATDHMRGRMQGAFTVVVGGGPRVADLLHGTIGAAIGTTVAISGGGALSVIGILVVVALLPGLWRYSLAQGEHPAAPAA